MNQLRARSRPAPGIFPAAALALAFLIVVSGGCGKKSRPVPLPPPVSSTSTSGETAPREVDPTAPRPELTIFLEPPSVARGESSILSWETKNADRVTISPGVGPVISSGRIKLFPEATTTYQVTAEGPGGTLTKTATLEVSAGDAPPVWDDEEIETGTLEERFTTAVKPVFFGFDSAELTDQARITLDGNVRWLNRPDNRKVRFVIEGHCDQRGTEEYNLALGDKRSLVVRDYLVSRGVDPARMATVSLGEERPFATGTSEEDYELNRRAHFVLLTEPE